MHRQDHVKERMKVLGSPTQEDYLASLILSFPHLQTTLKQ